MVPKTFEPRCRVGGIADAEELVWCVLETLLGLQGGKVPSIQHSLAHLRLGFTCITLDAIKLP